MIRSYPEAARSSRSKRRIAAWRRALVAVAGLAVLAGPEREDELRTALVDGLAPYRRADGSYRLSNEYHVLLARA